MAVALSAPIITLSFSRSTSWKLRSQFPLLWIHGTHQGELLQVGMAFSPLAASLAPALSIVIAATALVPLPKKTSPKKEQGQDKKNYYSSSQR